MRQNFSSPAEMNDMLIDKKIHPNQLPILICVYERSGVPYLTSI